MKTARRASYCRWAGQAGCSKKSWQRVSSMPEAPSVRFSWPSMGSNLAGCRSGCQEKNLPQQKLERLENKAKVIRKKDRGGVEAGMRNAEGEQKTDRVKPHTAAREALENKHFGKRCVRFFDTVEIGVEWEPLECVTVIPG